jgi:4a-hydroxytetrahydrobiopterin dehydratase
MARFCDETAEAMGEVLDDAEGKGSVVGKELADRVATDGKDCCVPKKT